VRVALLRCARRSTTNDSHDAIKEAPQMNPITSTVDALHIDVVPAFRDNYIWLLTRGSRAAVVDPGDAAPVLEVLRQRGLTLETIVVTHHHADHVGGVAALVQAHGARVLAPAASPYPGGDQRLRDGDKVTVLGEEFAVLAVPGHTLDHIAYWSAALGVLFCGDTLFACGCGRLFEGSAQQMAASLARLAALPPATRVYCAHEYTSDNIRFALAVEPDNQQLVARSAECAALRQRGQPTVPSTVGLELATNPFLRCSVAGVQAAAQQEDPEAGKDVVAVFAALRSWKNTF
jgi:hydroxyacylglutathione hydrolase